MTMLLAGDFETIPHFKSISAKRPLVKRAAAASGLSGP
jgi:hypothetical protein